MMDDHSFDPTCVLKVNLSCCNVCPVKLEKGLMRIDGVNSVGVHREKRLVYVRGNVDPMKLIKLIEKWGKRAELVSYEDPTKADHDNVDDGHYDHGHDHERGNEEKKKKNAHHHHHPPDHEHYHGHVNTMHGNKEERKKNAHCRHPDHDHYHSYVDYMNRDEEETKRNAHYHPHHDHYHGHFDNMHGNKEGKKKNAHHHRDNYHFQGHVDNMHGNREEKKKNAHHHCDHDHGHVDNIHGDKQRKKKNDDDHHHPDHDHDHGHADNMHCNKEKKKKNAQSGEDYRCDMRDDFFEGHRAEPCSTQSKENFGHMCENPYCELHNRDTNHHNNPHGMHPMDHGQFFRGGSHCPAFFGGGGVPPYHHYRPEFPSGSHLRRPMPFIDDFPDFYNDENAGGCTTM